MPETLQLSNPAPLTTLTEDEILFRDNVRQFADDKIRPLAKEMDEKAVFDHSLIDQFFQLGLMGIEIPEQYGGAGGKFFEAILAVEECSRADASAGVIVDVQNTLVANAILRWANEDQKKRYLPKLAADTVGAYALSEAGSGSDAFALQTKAELKGTDFLLNGRKLWITNSKEAGLFILFATVDASKGYKGITAFLIEKSFPGFTVGKKEDKLGIRASSTCELILEDCRVPKANVLGEVGKGYKVAIETLNEGRIGIGAQMLGVARGAWECAAKYAQERTQFGKPIAEFQGIQFQIAQMATEIEAARLMVYNAARMKDGGVNFVISRHGQALHVANCGACDLAGYRNLRRIRLYERLSGRKVLARLEDRQDLRRHLEHAIGDDRQAADGKIRPEVRSQIAEVEKRGRWFLLLQSNF